MTSQANAIVSRYGVSLVPSREDASLATSQALPRVKAQELVEELRRAGHEASDAPENADRSLFWVYVTPTEDRPENRIDTAIAQSIAETRTVRLADLTPAEVEALDAECEDSADLDAATEWWGIDEDGGAWRIEATLAAAAR